MNLVIVESPTKAKTLSKILGKQYQVKASFGHVRDLPKSELGVDIGKDFEPSYVVPPKVRKNIRSLRQGAQKAETLLLATDPDREGEAIAFHLVKALNLPTKGGPSVKRVVFHEVTKPAVLDALKKPRQIDMLLVDSQKARRVLDRLVGYKLSPLLWEKVRYGLSAGRVQSVTVRLVVEREREIERFKAEKYWTVAAEFLKEGGESQTVEAELVEKDGQNIWEEKSFDLFAGSYTVRLTKIKSEREAQKIIADIKSSRFVVSEISRKALRRNPYPPFTTSTLQQEASYKLGFPGSKTMKIAQALFERGYITYHRTDSTNQSPLFLSQVRELIAQELGKEYLPGKARRYKTKSRLAQEAHEAIRPTFVSNLKTSCAKVNSELGREAVKLFELIWRRAVASQVAAAIFETTTVKIAANGDYTFRASGSVLKFDGFLKIYPTKMEEKLLPELVEGERLELGKISTKEHLTPPPPRYNEASLIKALEEFGIGRPSTYAPTIAAIQDRGYVRRVKGYFIPETVGFVVNDLLVANFPEIVDIEFTARMEEDLDDIASGRRKWVPVVRSFYTPFEKQLTRAQESLIKSEVTTLERVDETCPECGKELVVKLGKYGEFLSCSGFPECKYARPYEDRDHNGELDKIDHSQLESRCPECGGELAVKEGKYGKFISCSNYPQCKFTKPYLEKIGVRCPQCKRGEVIIRRTRRGKVFYGCSNYPQCRWASWKDPREKGGPKKAA